MGRPCNPMAESCSKLAKPRQSRHGGSIGISAGTLVKFSLMLVVALVSILMSESGSNAEAKASSQSAGRVVPSTDRFSSVGKFKVERRLMSLYDPERKKELELAVTFPSDGARHPLIVFSHGAFGSRDGYLPLIEHWSSHGYICIQPTHEDSLKYFVRDRVRSLRGQGNLTRDRSQRQAVIKDNFAQWQTSSFANWKSRPLDVKLILDSLSAIEQKVPEIKGRIDTNRIGMGGHSFGAHTAQVLGGTMIGGMSRLKDDRPVAFLLMSPQGEETGFGGDGLLGGKSWSFFTRPMMVMTGTEDKGRHGNSYEWRLAAYEKSPPGNKYLIVIKDGHHGFGGISGDRKWTGSGPKNAEHVNWTKAATLAYWDAYLSGSKTASAYLHSKKLASDSGDQLLMKEK